MGSIPTRSRHAASRRALGALALAAWLPAAAAAQGKVPTAADSIPRAQKPTLSPGAAALRSFLVPGWGQLRLGRRIEAGIFIAGEVLTVSQAVRFNGQAGDLRDRIDALDRRSTTFRADSSALAAQLRDANQSREDWYMFIAFNHLLAALEAYVAGHLADFPADLRLRVYPGRAEVGATVPLP
ncbi:MAG: DUF5683 domain-containing protein [Gemmatimonadales bacterium]|nr:DUF5683 domain-containing protein [Gemmatimonadales bacterium]